MAPEAIRALTQATIALAVSAAAVLALARVAPVLGLLDVPGGRKAHGRPVPLVGGIAIFAALLFCASSAGLLGSFAWFLLALSLVLAIGVWDDVAEVSPSAKLAVQVAACAVMIWGEGMEIHAVGDLFGWRPIGLWVFAAPMTVVSVVGVMNSMNMMDGIDGLAGSIALVAFGWYAAIAWQSGLTLELQTAVMLCGAMGGFLLFNVRTPRRPHAHVFLGDAGSLTSGFALAWFAIDLTQGPERSLPPIAALWVVLLPLADCVSVMARRLGEGRNPFDGDRYHLHHYLLARGYGEPRVLATLVGISALFGAVGFAGWRLEVPEPVLFWPFFFGFFAYHAWIQRAWKKLEAERAPMPALLLEVETARPLG